MKHTFTKLLFLVSFILGLQGFQSVAQTPEKVLIQGKITDAKDKSTIIGATVVEQDKNDKRTLGGISTNIDGNFALKVTNTENKLSISFIGYKSIVLDIGGQRVFNIALQPDQAELKDVVVRANRTVSNGTGLNIDERNLTTASSTLNAKDVQELQAASIDQAIQGRLPGVDIVANSGDPGAGMSIRIRGTSTINGVTNPLIVVDGIPYQTEVPEDFNFATADSQEYANLLSLSPTDIQDITVLKDAAATAVWGSRASNGVLIINTKRGTVGKPNINYSFKGSFSNTPSPIPLLNGDQYSTLIPQEVLNAQGIPLNTTTVKEFEYDPQDSYYYYNYSKNTDWVKAVTQTGYTADNNLSITGGGEKARYYASLGYYDQKGTTIATGLKRISTRVNLDYIISDRLHFTTFINYTHSNTDGNFSPSGSSGIGNVAINKMPNQSIYEYNEYGVQTPNYFSPASNVQGQYPKTYNPVALANSAFNNTINDRVTPHFNITYYVIPSLLTATTDIGFDINNSRNGTFLPQTATGRPITETSVNRASNFDYDTYNVQSKTNFIITPNLGDKQTFQGLFSVQTYDNNTLSQSQLTSNTASTELTDSAIPGRTQNSDLGIQSAITQTRTVAALISAQYSFLDRYIVNVGLRGDGNSRFGPNHRYGLFPSISARYRLSGEPFMQKFSSWMDDLSFRASYGQSGNAPGKDYTFYNTYTNFTYTDLGQSGLYSQNIQLDNLHYETVIGQNLGLNLILFKNKINLDVEFYRNRTKDLLQDGIQISSFNGYNSISMNVGTLDNQGFEVSLFTTPYRSKTWSVDFNFNIAQNVNVVRSISPYYPNSSGNVNANGSYLSLLQVNNPLSSIYGYKYKGVYKDAPATIATDKNGKPIIGPDGAPVNMHFYYPTNSYVFQPGDAKYEDINHDGNIDYRDVVYLGNGNPKFTGGFGPTIGYKNFRLQLFFNFRTGYQIVNGTQITTTNMYSFNNQSTAVLSRWQHPGDITNTPRALYNYGYNWLASDRYVQDGSFLRFRSATLRYNFDSAFLSKLRLKSLGVYLTAEGLYTWTRYLGQDPEVSVKSTGIFAQVIDYSTTPPSKTFTFGLTAGF